MMGWGKSAQVSDLGKILDCSQAHGDLVWAWGIENLLIKAIKGCRELAERTTGGSTPRQKIEGT